MKKILLSFLVAMLFMSCENGKFFYERVHVTNTAIHAPVKPLELSISADKKVCSIFEANRLYFHGLTNKNLDELCDSVLLCNEKGESLGLVAYTLSPQRLVGQIATTAFCSAYLPGKYTSHLAAYKGGKVIYESKPFTLTVKNTNADIFAWNWAEIKNVPLSISRNCYDVFSNGFDLSYRCDNKNGVSSLSLWAREKDRIVAPPTPLVNHPDEVLGNYVSAVYGAPLELKETEALDAFCKKHFTNLPNDFVPLKAWQTAKSVIVLCEDSNKCPLIYAEPK